GEDGRKPTDDRFEGHRCNGDTAHVFQRVGGNPAVDLGGGAVLLRDEPDDFEVVAFAFAGVDELTVFDGLQLLGGGGGFENGNAFRAVHGSADLPGAGDDDDQGGHGADDYRVDERLQKCDEAFAGGFVGFYRRVGDGSGADSGFVG